MKQTEYLGSDFVKPCYPSRFKEGERLDQGGGSEVLHGTARWAGPGHNSTYTWDGKDYLVFHAYDGKNRGLPKLKVLQLHWDAEQWPVVDVDAGALDR